MGCTYIVLLLYLTKISYLNFIIQIFLIDDSDDFVWISIDMIKGFRDLLVAKYPSF